jgi:hypothetical protein
MLGPPVQPLGSTCAAVYCSGLTRVFYQDATGVIHESRGKKDVPLAEYTEGVLVKSSAARPHTPIVAIVAEKEVRNIQHTFPSYSWHLFADPCLLHLQR